MYKINIGYLYKVLIERDLKKCYYNGTVIYLEEFEMKKLLSILVVALALCLAVTFSVSAATADIVIQSVEGTAVIDGVKDEAYADAQALEFVQQGDTNGNGQVNDYSDATAYVINDAEYAYVFVDVHDDNLDNSGSIAYDRDSVELFWMVDNAKAQIRYHYDGTIDEDSGENVESAAVVTDTGYAIEAKIPLTDVRNNQLEMCIQINVCTDGLRQYTCYIEGNAEGDRAYARANRQSENDCWWTLALAGEHEDTITDETATPAPSEDDAETDPAVDETEEQPVNNVVQPDDNLYPVALDDYNGLSQIPFMTRVFTQSHYNWKLVELGAPITGTLGQTVEANWTDIKGLIEWLDEDTNGFSHDPYLVLQMSDDEILSEGLPSDAAVGDLGYVGYYTFTFTDITINSDGFETVVIPGDTVENYKLVPKNEGGWISGGAYEYNLSPYIKQTLGLDTVQLCEFISNITSISTTVTLDAYNGVTADMLEELKAEAEAAEAAVLEEINGYSETVSNAESVVNDEAASIEDKKTAAEDALEAANNAVAAAEGYPDLLETANALLETANELNDTVAELEEAEAVTETEQLDEEEPVADEDSSVDTQTAADAGEQGSSTVVIVVVIVVVIAVVAVIAVLAAKKKK